MVSSSICTIFELLPWDWSSEGKETMNHKALDEILPNFLMANHSQRLAIDMQEKIPL